MLDTQHQSLTGRKQSTPRAGEGLRAGAARLGRAAQTRLDDPPSSRPACNQAGLLLTRVRLALDRRLVVASPLAYLYPRLHHANVALRTAYLDREVT